MGSGPDELLQEVEHLEKYKYSRRLLCVSGQLKFRGEQRRIDGIHDPLQIDLFLVERRSNHGAEPAQRRPGRTVQVLLEEVGSRLCEFRLMDRQRQWGDCVAGSRTTVPLASPCTQASTDSQTGPRPSCSRETASARPAWTSSIAAVFSTGAE